MSDIQEVAPTDPALADLIARHLELMYASSPACSVHAMDAEALAGAGVRFFAVIEAGQAIAMGALKPINATHGEIKSMHVRSDRRGAGLADAMLAHLLETARQAGWSRVSLETGSQEAFAPARGLYGRAGFNTCGPFEGYEADPNSVFMTCAL
ncbi:MAG: GNAT family N-acetyltransferase [Pseudomonadota bacterium]